AYAFQKNPITAITNLPTTLKTIGTSAFSETDITEITLPSGVSSLGNNAFYNCKQLVSADLSRTTITTISNNMFQGCTALKSVALSNTLTSIGNTILSSTGLDYIKIPASVRSISSTAFNSFRGTIDLSDHNLYAISGSPWGAGSTTTILWKDSDLDGDFAFNKSTGLILGLNPAYNGNGNIVIPVEIDGVVVKGFASGAFKSSTIIRSVRFEAGSQITEIAASTFSGNGRLTSVILPEGITSIGNYAFEGTRLDAIDLPDGLISIGSYAFQSSISLTHITIPEGIKSLDSYVFYQCTALTSVTLPESLTSIGMFAFYNTKLTEVRIPALVQTISSSAFRAETPVLKTITFEGSAIRSIAVNAFTFSVENIYLTHKNKDSIADRPWGAVNATIYWADATDAPAIVTDDSGLWQFNTVTAAVTAYLGPIAARMDLTIPASLSYGGVDYSITQVGEDNKNVVPANSVLGRLSISDGITRINGIAFRNVRISELDWGTTVTYITNQAFSGSR
ncbi:MAG: leucine-rich repeat domain-containing protein, partial [Oscillospiraceae bacterium]|nr:leucine-rich repeat domain-containing protein [Oscillospiraceae bacterium]